VFSTLREDSLKVREILHMNNSTQGIFQGIFQGILNRANSFRRVFVIALVSLCVWGMTFVALAHADPAHANSSARDGRDGTERAGDGIEYYKNDRSTLQTTERYNQIQPETGGMNNFDDVDPRMDTRESDAKARAMSDAASRRSAQAADPLESARKTIKSAKDNLSGAVNDLTDKVGG
jgi:hypothetical protein